LEPVKKTACYSLNISRLAACIWIIFLNLKGMKWGYVSYHFSHHYINYCILCNEKAEKKPSRVVATLNPIQKEAAGSLFEALSLPDTPEALYLFHRFSWSLLVRQEDNKEVTDWSCPFLCYFAVLALHPCGNLMSPDEYSGHRAKFKYFCNNVGIFKADLRADKHPQGMIG
jgi:hypothetical protein